QDLLHRKSEKRLADTKDLDNLFLNIKAVVFHTMAAARASAGDFGRATEYAQISLHAAETFAKEVPSTLHQQLLTRIQETTRLIQSNQALHSARPLPVSIIE